MARRGGGGHSSGGSHSHHSSSHSSHSGGHSAPRRRYSHTHFPGARRYVYYRNRTPYVFYCDSDVRNDKFIQRPLLILFYIPFIFALFMMLTNSFGGAGRKLNTSYDTSIVIEDNIGAVNDDSGLKKTLEKFRDKTGITPRVVTVEYKNWEAYSKKNPYDEFGDYALDLYYDYCSNENYWLMVYTNDNHYNEWHWEHIMGDNIEDIVTDNINDVFTGAVQTSLYSQNNNGAPDFGVALEAGFDKIQNKVMKVSFHPEVFLSALVMGAFIFFHAYFMVGINFKAKYHKNALLIPDNAVSERCSFCGSEFYRGEYSNTCPHCGASIPNVAGMGMAAAAVAGSMNNTNTYSSMGNSYSSAQNSYNTANNSYGASGNSYSSAQNSYNTANNSYGASGNSYGSAQNSYGTANNNYGAVQNNYGSASQTDYDSILGGNVLNSSIGSTTSVSSPAPSVTTGHSTSYTPTDNPYVTYNGTSTLGSSTVTSTPLPSVTTGHSTSYTPTDNPYVTYNGTNTISSAPIGAMSGVTPAPSVTTGHSTSYTPTDNPYVTYSNNNPYGNGSNNGSNNS